MAALAFIFRAIFISKRIITSVLATSFLTHIPTPR
jgi:hypothetical protein